MRDLRDRATWLPISEQKPIPPYTLDPTLTFYCPQENVEALYHPDVRALHAHMRDEYKPPTVPGKLVGLLLPCTKAKPYSMSKEHLEINRYLLERGFKPIGRPDYPDRLRAALPPGRTEPMPSTWPWAGAETVRASSRLSSSARDMAQCPIVIVADWM